MNNLCFRPCWLSCASTKGSDWPLPKLGFIREFLGADTGAGPLAFINPRIIKRSGGDVIEEGCLSIPGVTVMVRRSERIAVRYIDENNQPHERVYDEMMARVIQHEMDHLGGKLIVDHAGIKEKIKLRTQLKELEREQREIE